MSREQIVVSNAEKRLEDSSHFFSLTVSCQYHDGVLRLDGKVPSFYLKQKAQTITRDVDGVDRVDNALVVVNPHGVSSETAFAY